MMTAPHRASQAAIINLIKIVQYGTNRFVPASLHLYIEAHFCCNYTPGTVCESVSQKKWRSWPDWQNKPANSCVSTTEGQHTLAKPLEILWSNFTNILDLFALSCFSTASAASEVSLKKTMYCKQSYFNLSCFRLLKTAEWIFSVI